MNTTLVYIKKIFRRNPGWPLALKISTALTPTNNLQLSCRIGEDQLLQDQCRAQMGMCQAAKRSCKGPHSTSARCCWRLMRSQKKLAMTTTMMISVSFLANFLCYSQSGNDQQDDLAKFKKFFLKEIFSVFLATYLNHLQKSVIFFVKNLIKFWLLLLLF